MLRLSLVAFIFLLSCAGKNNSSNSQQSDSLQKITVAAKSEDTSHSSFPYDINHPDEKFKLPEQLTEISGIDVYKKNKLVCENDEKGKVYIYDVKKGELKQGVDFGKKGDYEGIANVNDTIYVLSSHGKLYQVTGFETADQKTNEFKTQLTEENDAEGLCYDPKFRQLLVACKKNPGNGLSGVRAIYSFDLKSMQLSAQPVYTIKLEDLKSFLLKTDKEKLMSEEFKNLFDPQKGDVTFQPSEVAIHPLTDEIYLISTVGKLMVVMNRAGTILQIQSLDPDIFKQPEGLCFLENGDMYISDEGREGKANILFFRNNAQ